MSAARNQCAARWTAAHSNTRTIKSALYLGSGLHYCYYYLYARWNGQAKRARYSFSFLSPHFFAAPLTLGSPSHPSIIWCINWFALFAVCMCRAPSRCNIVQHHQINTCLFVVMLSTLWSTGRGEGDRENMFDDATIQMNKYFTTGESISTMLLL